MKIEVEFHYVHVIQDFMKMLMVFVNNVLNHVLNVALVQMIVQSVMGLELQNQIVHAQRDTTKLLDKLLVNHVLLNVVDVLMPIHAHAVILHTS